MEVLRTLICASAVTALAVLGKVEGTPALLALVGIALPSIAGTLAEKFIKK